MGYSVEQLTHDEINLKGLARQLEKSISDPFWDESPKDDVRIKAQGTLQVDSRLTRHVFSSDFGFLNRK